MSDLFYGDITVLGTDKQAVDTALIAFGLLSIEVDEYGDQQRNFVSGVAATFGRIILQKPTEETEAVYGDYACSLRVNGVNLGDLDYVPTDYDLHPNFGREGVPQAPPPKTRDEWRSKASLSRQAFLTALVVAKILPAGEALEAAKGNWPETFANAISGLPDDAKFQAQLTWATATEISRTHPLIAVLASYASLQDQQVDTLFGYINK